MVKRPLLRLILKNTPLRFPGAPKSINWPLKSHHLSKSRTQESCLQRGLDPPRKRPLKQLSTTQCLWWNIQSCRTQKELSSPLCSLKIPKKTSQKWQKKKRLSRSDLKTKLSILLRSITRSRLIRTCLFWSRRSRWNDLAPNQTFPRYLNRRDTSKSPAKTKKRPR